MYRSWEKDLKETLGRVLEDTVRNKLLKFFYKKQETNRNRGIPRNECDTRLAEETFKETIFEGRVVN